MGRSLCVCVCVWCFLWGCEQVGRLLGVCMWVGCSVCVGYGGVSRLWVCVGQSLCVCERRLLGVCEQVVCCVCGLVAVCV